MPVIKKRKMTPAIKKLLSLTLLLSNVIEAEDMMDEPLPRLRVVVSNTVRKSQILHKKEDFAIVFDKFNQVFDEKLRNSNIQDSRTLLPLILNCFSVQQRRKFFGLEFYDIPTNLTASSLEVSAFITFLNGLDEAFGSTPFVNPMVWKKKQKKEKKERDKSKKEKKKIVKKKKIPKKIKEEQKEKARIERKERIERLSKTEDGLKMLIEEAPLFAKDLYKEKLKELQGGVD